MPYPWRRNKRALPPQVLNRVFLMVFLQKRRDSSHVLWTGGSERL